MHDSVMGAGKKEWFCSVSYTRDYDPLIVSSSPEYDVTNRRQNVMFIATLAIQYVLELERRYVCALLLQQNSEL
jgi:hypothetical protein